MIDFIYLSILSMVVACRGKRRRMLCSYQILVLDKNLFTAVCYHFQRNLWYTYLYYASYTTCIVFYAMQDQVYLFMILSNTIDFIAAIDIYNIVYILV